MSKTIHQAPQFGVACYLCPACGRSHCIVVGGEGVPALHKWDGNTEKPTFEGRLRIEAGDAVCDASITSGRAQFSADSTHALAGLEANLPEWPKDWK